MNKLENYINGRWITGDGEGQALYDAVNGQLITHATSKGIDFAGSCPNEVYRRYSRTNR